MSQSALPAVLQGALATMNQPQPGFDPFDPAYRAWLLEWGLEQIAREIRPDPIFRPLDYPRKAAAEREWRAAVREQGKILRGVATAASTALAQEVINQKIFEFQEIRRQQQLQADASIQVWTHGELSEIDTVHMIRRAEELARINAHYQPTAPVDAFTLTKLYEAEIDKIEQDPRLSQEEKHRRTQFWRDALQAALRGST